LVRSRSLPRVRRGRGRIVTFPNFLFLYYLSNHHHHHHTIDSRLYELAAGSKIRARRVLHPKEVTSSSDTDFPNPGAGAMPNNAIDLGPHREEIERRILIQKQSQKEILSWLAGRGIICTRMTLSRYCKSWGVRKNTTSSATDPALLEGIRLAFDTTFDNDETIAKKLAAQGIHTTRNQVEKIRLKHG
jgi:hypothetical protein